MDKVNTIKQSPAPTIGKPDEKRMNFGEAMEQVVQGKKIHKLEWEDRDYYGYLKEGRLTIRSTGNAEHDWIVSEGDLLGEDYIVIE